MLIRISFVAIFSIDRKETILSQLTRKHKAIDFSISRIGRNLWWIKTVNIRLFSSIEECKDRSKEFLNYFWVAGFLFLFSMCIWHISEKTTVGREENKTTLEWSSWSNVFPSINQQRDREMRIVFIIEILYPNNLWINYISIPSVPLGPIFS